MWACVTTTGSTPPTAMWHGWNHCYKAPFNINCSSKRRNQTPFADEDEKSQPQSGERMSCGFCSCGSSPRRGATATQADDNRRDRVPKLAVRPSRRSSNEEINGALEAAWVGLIPRHAHHGIRAHRSCSHAARTHVPSTTNSGMRPPTWHHRR